MGEKLLKIPTWDGVKAKQHTAEWPTNHRRNQKRNQNVHRNEWKWKHNNPKPVGHCKSSAKGKFIAIQAYLKKQEKSQIDNLTLHLKQLEKEEMKKPRVSRRKEILKIRAEINAKETKRDHSKNQQSQKLVLWKDK